MVLSRSSKASSESAYGNSETTSVSMFSLRFLDTDLNELLQPSFGKDTVHAGTNFSFRQECAHDAVDQQRASMLSVGFTVDPKDALECVRMP